MAAKFIEEYDEPKPVTHSYCAPISAKEFERQGSSETAKALQELLSYLDKHPEAYHSIMKRRKEEEEAESGFFSYLKSRFMSLMTGSKPFAVSDEECSEKLTKVKGDMVQVFAYSQSEKDEHGRRCSKRLAEKREKEAEKISSSSSPILVTHKRRAPATELAAPPPLPPPLPRLQDTQSVSSRSPLSLKNVDYQKQKLIRKPLKRSTVKKGSNGSSHPFLADLKGSTMRKKLKKTTGTKSPGGTPVMKMKRQISDENASLFNQQLIEKFRNVYSPRSPANETDTEFQSP